MNLTFINREDESKKIELRCDSMTNCNIGFVLMLGDNLTYINDKEWRLLNVRTVTTNKHKELLIPAFMR